MPRAQDVLVIAGPPCLVALLALHPMIANGMVPDYGAFSDTVGFWYPLGVVLQRAFTSGQLPFWNPSVFGGAALMADPGSAALYPINLLLYRVLSAADALRVTLLLHIGIAYMGTYAFLRILRLSRAASIYGALAFAFSSWLFFRIILPPMLMANALVPVLFLCAEGIASAGSARRRAVSAAALSIVVAFDMLIGLAQVTYYTLLAVTAYLVVILVSPTQSSGLARVLAQGRRLAIWVFLPLALGVALSAIQLVPALEFVRTTDLAGGYPRGQTVGGLGLADLWAFVGAGRAGETGTFYAGALCLTLAPLTAFQVRQRRVAAFGALAVLTILLATSYRHPLRVVASLILPGWSVFEDHEPARAMVLVVFSLAVLTAWTIDRACRGLPGLAVLAAPPLAVMLIGFAVGATSSNTPPLAPASGSTATSILLTAMFMALNLLVLAFWRLARFRRAAEILAIPSLIALLVADLLAHNAELGIRFAYAEETFSSSSTAKFLSEVSAEPFRFFGFSQPEGYQDVSRAAILLNSNAANVYELNDVEGYNPLQSSRYRELLRASNRRETDYRVAEIVNPLSPLLRYLNTRFVVVPVPVGQSTAQLWGSLYLDASSPSETLSVNSLQLSDVAVDSNLAFAGNIQQGTTVSVLTVLGADHAQSFPIRAGIETAEWIYDAPGVREGMQHQRPASIAHSFPTDAGVEGHTYHAVLHLDRPTAIIGLRFDLLLPQIKWNIEQVTTGPNWWKDAYRLAFSSPEALVLEARDVLPRGYLVHEVEWGSGPAILDRLQSPDFDPRRRVILEQPPDTTAASVAPTLVADGQWAAPGGEPQAYDDESVDIQTSNPNQLVARVRAGAPGLLVLSENDYPAWQAYVDSQPTRIYRADYAFRAIVTPAGEHTIELRYEARAFFIGGLVSLVALSVLLPGAFWLWRRNASLNCLDKC